MKLEGRQEVLRRTSVGDKLKWTLRNQRIFLNSDTPPPLVVVDIYTYCDYLKVNREEEQETKNIF